MMTHRQALTAQRNLDELLRELIQVKQHKVYLEEMMRKISVELDVYYEQNDRGESS